MEQPKLEYREDSIRYYFGEMTAVEEEAFEAQMFAEPELAADLRSLEEFQFAVQELESASVENAPVPAHPEPERPGWVKWLQGLFRPEVMIPSAAALGLGIVVLSQNAGLQNAPGMLNESLPQVLAYSMPSVMLTANEDRTRGAETVAALPAGVAGYHLQLNLANPEAHEAYDAEIHTAGGEFLYRASVALADGYRVSLFVPGTNLTPGDYELVISGRSASGEPHSGVTAATAPFRVE